jgi:hypothetical protein
MALSGSVCVSADGSWGMQGCVCVAEYFLQCIEYSPEVFINQNGNYKDGLRYSLVLTITFKLQYRSD